MLNVAPTDWRDTLHDAQRNVPRNSTNTFQRHVVNKREKHFKLGSAMHFVKT
jgi:hypothetical protein